MQAWGLLCFHFWIKQGGEACTLRSPYYVGGDSLTGGEAKYVEIKLDDSSKEFTQCLVHTTYSMKIAAAAAKSLQSCPTLCDPIDGSPPVSPVPGILQARTLKWVAISFSNAWKWKAKGKSLSRVRLLAAPWTAAYQAPPSIGFSRQGYWSGVNEG